MMVAVYLLGFGIGFLLGTYRERQWWNQSMHELVDAMEKRVERFNHDK